MNPQERQIIDDLFDKLRHVEQQVGPREPNAETHIRTRIERQPGAPYYMAQTIVIQEQALQNAQARIAELEDELARRPAGGGFLSGLFGGGSQPQPRPPQRPPDNMQGMAPPGGGFGSGVSAPGMAAQPRPRWGSQAAWCSAAFLAMRSAEAVRRRQRRRLSLLLLRTMTTSAGTSEVTSARTSSSRCLRRTRTHRVIRREHKPVRALAHGSRHHGRRSTVRMRTLALAGAVAVSALALQPALAQTTAAPGQPGAPGAGTPPASPSTSGTQPSATAPAQPATPMKQMTVSALTDKDLVGARDNEVGDIERVVESNA